MDLPTKQQPAQDSGVKLEVPDVQMHVHTQGTGSSSQRETGGQDPSVIDLEDEPLGGQDPGVTTGRH